jgi:hypothetical protein
MHLERTSEHADVVFGWCAKIAGLVRVLGGILLFTLLPAQTFAVALPPGQSIVLTWSPNTNGNVASYNIYYGTASQSYTKVVNAGNVTSTVISGLTPGVTYYFSVTACDSLGGQSDYSSEVSYTVSTVVLPTPAVVQITPAPAGQFNLTVSAPAGSYNIQATQDFTTWTVIGTVNVGDSGSLEFTDTNAASFPQRFYRISN